MSTKKLISIVGPTATGKTKFALQLIEAVGKRFSHVDLISADSRQVYKDLEVGTGVDIDPLLLKEKYPNLNIHGLSIILPTEEWSLTHFRHLVEGVLQQNTSVSRLILLVGGTGLYHDFAFLDDPDFEVNPNPVVRQKAEQMTVKELQDWLRSLNGEQFTQMNHSDQHNPRRLIRRIEIALASPVKKTPSSPSPTQLPHLTVGLTDTMENIADRIQQRVKDRLQTGMLEEVQKLIANYPDQDWKRPAFSATGYKEVRGYLEGNLEYDQMVELWNRREVQYAKRQMTWWKKQQGVQWFDVSQPQWSDPALALVLKWLDNEVY